MQTLKQFAKRMRSMPELIKQGVNEVTSKMVIDIAIELAQRTPVDTSTAISNWRAEIGKPDRRFIYPHYAGKKGSTFSLSSAETIRKAASKVVNRKYGDVTYISNNAPYIRFLNYGTSKMPALNFVEQAVLVAKRKKVPFRIPKK